LTGVPARTLLWPLSFAIKVETGENEKESVLFLFFVILNFPFDFVRERLAAPVGRVGGIIQTLFTALYLCNNNKKKENGLVFVDFFSSLQ